jgi:hypothetical protein
MDALHHAIGLKELAQFLISRRVGKIADKNLRLMLDSRVAIGQI